MKLKNINTTLLLFSLAIFLEGLDAYSIISIPLSWIGISVLVFIFFILSAILSLDGLDFITALSGSASAISNVGPGLGDVIAPNGNFSNLPTFSKLSVFFGILFLKEPYNKQKALSVFLVMLSVTYLLFNFNSVPWTGLIVAITWSTYSFLRKKISVDSDIGLLIESLFITPLALIIFYLIALDGNYYFSLTNPKIAFWLFLAGPMTVIPLFLFLKGVDLAGLGTSGMIFFITPTCQFLLGFFYYNEYFDFNKLIGFIIIWIAVAIYLHDLSREKIRN